MAPTGQQNARRSRIESLSNPLVKRMRLLREKRHRRAEGLFLAEGLGWPAVYTIMGVLMLAIGFASLFAPDGQQTAATIAADAETLLELRAPGELEPRVRAIALSVVGVLWIWALVTVGIFMVRSLGSDPGMRPDSVAFVAKQGPLIVIATVVIPEENCKDLAEIPENILAKLEVRPVRWIDQVLEHAHPVHSRYKR